VREERCRLGGEGGAEDGEVREEKKRRR